MHVMLPNASTLVSPWPVTHPWLHMQDRHPEHILQLCGPPPPNTLSTNKLEPSSGHRELHWKTNIWGPKHDLQNTAQFIWTINLTSEARTMEHRSCRQLGLRHLLQCSREELRHCIVVYHGFPMTQHM